jgi:hypothetical protein
MGIFGWDYPPGCSSTPFDEPEPPCNVCGQFDDYCICPECPVCGCYGDPRCYINHGLRRSEKQKFFMEVNQRQWEEDNNAYWHDMNMEVEEPWP